MDKKDIIVLIKDHEAELDIEKPIMLPADGLLIQDMVMEINTAVNGRFRGYSDIVDQYIQGAGEIVLKYICLFEEQMVRASLLHHLVGNKAYSIKAVKHAPEIVWKLYEACRDSKEYAVWGVQRYYDDAFVRLRSKVLADRLIESIKNPLEFSALSRTVKMLATWKKPELEAILLDVLENPKKMEEYLKAPAVQGRFGFDQQQMERECRRWNTISVLKAVVGIQHYPSKRAIQLLRQYEVSKQAEMQEKMLACKTRTEKYDVQYDYGHIQKIVSKSIEQINKAIC